MKTVLLILSFMLAACSTTKNADGSTQVTLHLANLTQEIQRSLSPNAVFPIPEASSKKTPSAGPAASRPVIKMTAKDIKNFQKLFECRDGADFYAIVMSLEKYAVRESPDSESLILMGPLPVKVFGHEVAKATMFSSGEGIYRTYIDNKSVQALAKSAGIKKSKNSYIKYLDWRLLSVGDYEGVYYECSVNYERY